MNKLEKSTLPISNPRGGIRTSPTSDETILPNAPPMMTPIAISRTFPFMANSLNSFSIVHLLKSAVQYDPTSDLPFTGGVERITQREQVQIVCFDLAGERPIVVARGHLKPARQTIQDREVHPVIHREIKLREILEGWEHFVIMVQHDLAIEQRPIPFHGYPSAKTDRIRERVNMIFIEISRTGFTVKCHVFENAREVSAIDPLVPWSAGDRGSQFYTLKSIVFEIH